jgi:glutaminyl-tRNA synthetase
MTTTETPRSLNFIEEIIEADLAAGKHTQVVSRFPPEPNGYLHIGHAKSICLNFGVAAEYGGRCHLRFDDTNPEKEEQAYAEAIMRDVHWLGFDWGEHLYHASDYFDKLYEFALHLIREGKAYVDSQSADEIRTSRGTLKEPGKNSPYRDRPIEESLDLFERMAKGEFPGGSHVLRAKIDMSSPNMNMRDPVLYRIRHEEHHRSGAKWCVYPMYDYAHPISDALESITHSLCTLEFEDHRPLYDWCVDNIPMLPSKPRQIEFARLNLSYTVVSKRKLLRLVQEGHVNGWDDPRMPTLAALRRRGYTPESIRRFSDMVGVAKRENVIDVALLEHSVRDHLNRTANRVMGVLDPVRVVIENYPRGETEWFETPNNPEDASAGTRQVPFSGVVYIERDDFMEDPPKKFFRLAPGREVRLRSAYFITCTDVVKNDAGEIVEIRCTYDPATRGGDAPDGRRPKGTLHWVSAAHALDCEVRLYDRLFVAEDPEDVAEGEDFLRHINPDSLRVITHARLEPSVKGSPAETRYQFERLGYFVVDPDSTDDHIVFNRTVTLKDTWGKIAGR